MMKKLLCGIGNVDSYVDDVIIHNRTWAEHLSTLKEVFTRIRSAGITIKPSKCCAGYPSVDFVGHHVRQGHIHTQEDNIEKVQNAAIPQTVTQVRSFLGLTSYYRKFIANYASIAALLSDLTKRGCPTRVVTNWRAAVLVDNGSLSNGGFM